MPTRLEKQRPPVKLHHRRNTRFDDRGYAFRPHPVWGDSFGPSGGAGYISLTGINPSVFTATGGAGVFVLTGTGFTGTPTVNFCGTAITGANVVVNSVTQITVTTPSLSGFAALAGTMQPVFVNIAGALSNTLAVQVN